VETIPTDDANYDNVYACLERCHYHVVHYAGHGFHDENNSDDSGLSFWEKPNRAGDVKPMPIRVLRNLLAHSDARFFYLSCCVGAKGAPESSVHLTGNDFQGILEGVVRTGIPGVLGYRWNVWDTEAKELALAFYENLVIDLSLDLALFKARRALQQNKYYNETWASPVLVTQTI
jgi:CHAT domain-containing protein